MKQIWMIFLLAGALRSADVTVYQSEYNIVEPAVWLRAMDQAGKIYAGIGVRLHWQGKTADGAAGLPAVVVQYTMRNPSHPGAMAFARPFDPDRVNAAQWPNVGEPARTSTATSKISPSMAVTSFA